MGAAVLGGKASILYSQVHAASCDVLSNTLPAAHTLRRELPAKEKPSWLRPNGAASLGGKAAILLNGKAAILLCAAMLPGTGSSLGRLPSAERALRPP